MGFDYCYSPPASRLGYWEYTDETLHNYVIFLTNP